MRVVVAPKSLCIYKTEDRSSTLKFLNLIDTVALKLQTQIMIDLSTTNYASAAASVLLFALVNRVQLMLPGLNLVKFRWPKKEDNPDGHRLIVSTGLSVALLANNFDKIERLKNQDRYFQSAVEPFEQWKSTALMLQSKMLQSKRLLNQDQFSLLSTALSEAMLNVSHHAYEDVGFEEQIRLMGGKRWWQCSWFNAERNRVYFIICDLGSGIHNTFKTTSDKISETMSVEKALSSGHSRFINAGRGNGSEDIKRPIGTGCAESETLLVLTGHARYSYNSHSESPQCERLSEYIPGTLIEWSVVPRREDDG